MEDEAKAAREAVGALGELVKIAGEDPQAREAARNLGQAAVTITKTINTALLPLAAVNFAFEKARNYFAGQFERDLIDRTRDIPFDSIIDPKASIAGPTLQGIAFTHEEPELKDMFLNLLATAMDLRVAPNAHPAFVEIIKQLEGDEARLLRTVLRIQGSLPVVQVRSQSVGQEGWHMICNHVMDLRDTVTKLPVEDPKQAAMLDNWLRLGLVEVRYDEFLMGEQSYAWVPERPEYKRAKGSHESPTTTVSFERGRVGRTAFGSKFASAVGLLSEQQATVVPQGTGSGG
jgi:hypothetical protein